MGRASFLWVFLVFALGACSSHPLLLEPIEPLADALYPSRKLVVLGFVDETDARYEEGFWLDKAKEPVPSLSQLYAEALRETGAFASVEYRRSADESAVREEVGDEVYILSGRVERFKTRMVTHWWGWITPTTYLTALGFPFAPCYTDCDIQTRYRVVDARLAREVIPMTLAVGRSGVDLFGATYWTEKFHFPNIVNTAANSNIRALVAGVVAGLRATPNEKASGVAGG